MIKVNLLRNQTIHVRKTSTPALSRMGLIFFAIFLLSSGGMWGWNYYVTQQVTALKAKQKKLRKDEARLKQMQQELIRYDNLKQQRQSRIEAIEKLLESQKGPVRLLNHIIQSLPSDGAIWLTIVEQKDNRVRIVGHTQRPETIPAFMINLAEFGIFKDIELDVLEHDKDIAKFTLNGSSGAENEQRE